MPSPLLQYALALVRPRPPARPHRPRPPVPARRRAKLALALMPPAFLIVVLAAWCGAEAAVPEITDTDYHARLRLLRAAQAEHPDRPLGVAIGSSRVVWGFRPEQLPDSDPVLWFNMGHVGSGPTLNRVILHRLLRDGVRPAVVVVEIMPTAFVKENVPFTTGHLTLAELPLGWRYAANPLEYAHQSLRHRRRRITDLARVTDPLAGFQVHASRGGHLFARTEVTPDERARDTTAARASNQCLQRLTVYPGADRALRDTLRESAAHGIRVVLLRAPEGPTFRSWYEPDGLARFDAYIAGVAREYGADTLDAREWLDEEDFYDSHHPLARGADKFTARFAREMAARGY